MMSRARSSVLAAWLLQTRAAQWHAQDGPKRDYRQQDPAENHERDERAWIHIDILTPP